MPGVPRVRVPEGGGTLQAVMMAAGIIVTVTVAALLIFTIITIALGSVAAPGNARDALSIAREAQAQVAIAGPNAAEALATADAADSKAELAQFSADLAAAAADAAQTSADAAQVDADAAQVAADAAQATADAALPLCANQTCESTSWLYKVGACYMCGSMFMRLANPALVQGSNNLQNIIPRGIVSYVQEAPPGQAGIRRYMVTVVGDFLANIINNGTILEINFQLAAPTPAELGNPSIIGQEGGGGTVCCYGQIHRYPTCGALNPYFNYGASPYASYPNSITTFTMIPIANSPWSDTDLLVCGIAGSANLYTVN